MTFFDAKGLVNQHYHRWAFDPIVLRMENETILIVDDSLYFTEMLEDMLTSMKYKTISASDGRCGLQTALEKQPDLVFLDMNMPGMDGLEMLRELRGANCQFPVIFMTAYGSERIAIDAFRLGVRDYLRKPFTKEEARSAIDRALREKRLLREREHLDRTLQGAEAVQVTAVTLSHYLNNYLTALNGSLQLLQEMLPRDRSHPELLQLLENSRASSANIEAVMRVLQRFTDLKLSSYAGTTLMLDIEAAIEKELDALRRQS